MLRARLLSLIAWIVISIWSRLVRTRFVNRQILDQFIEEGKNAIFAFWHGRQFLLFHNHRNIGCVIPASESRDGDIQSGVLQRFGFDVVRGSSKRKGDRALLGMVQGLRKGKIVAMAVDGPRGPLHEVKPGILYLAGKLNKPIIPVATSAKWRWILKKPWDKYLLPVPFTKAVIVYGEPVVVDGTTEAELESKRQDLEKALQTITGEADEYFMTPTEESRG